MVYVFYFIGVLVKSDSGMWVVFFVIDIWFFEVLIMFFCGLIPGMILVVIRLLFFNCMI